MICKLVDVIFGEVQYFLSILAKILLHALYTFLLLRFMVWVGTPAAFDLPDPTLKQSLGLAIIIGAIL